MADFKIIFIVALAITYGICNVNGTPVNFWAPATAASAMVAATKFGAGKVGEAGNGIAGSLRAGVGAGTGYLQSGAGSVMGQLNQGASLAGNGAEYFQSGAGSLMDQLKQGASLAGNGAEYLQYGAGSLMNQVNQGASFVGNGAEWAKNVGIGSFPNLPGYLYDNALKSISAYTPARVLGLVNIKENFNLEDIVTHFLTATKNGENGLNIAATINVFMAVADMVPAFRTAAGSVSAVACVLVEVEQAYSERRKPETKTLLKGTILAFLKNATEDEKEWVCEKVDILAPLIEEYAETRDPEIIGQIVRTLLTRDVLLHLGRTMIEESGVAKPYFLFKTVINVLGAK